MKTTFTFVVFILLSLSNFCVSANGTKKVNYTSIQVGSLVIIQGNYQTRDVNTAFSTALLVSVRDEFANPVQNANITFTAPASGASGTFSNNTNSITVSTNSSGIASATFTANGIRGQYNISASYPGVNPVNFTLTNVSHRIYVNHANTSGPHNGASWATAYNDLQAALAAATANDSIWVAKGTYYPTTSTTDRSASFSMKNNVAIYGGFFGNETLLSQRNWEAYETILSGDIDYTTDPLAATGGGSTLSITGNSGNSYTVVKNVNNGLTNTAILDGFTILGGNNTSSNTQGGGMHNYSSSPSITNVIFKYNNSNTGGGGMYNYSSSPSITNVIFKSNSSISAGGGMWNQSSKPTIINTKFLSNYGNSGGGMINIDSRNTITIKNCIFSNNNAMNGGGIFNTLASDISIINSTFYNNTANSGRAIYRSDGTINLYNCILWNNGGSIAIYGGGQITTVSNCLIEPDAILASGTPATITQDPLFVDAANGDFRLKSCSPAIDKGATGGNISTTDIEGNARFDMPNVANEANSIVDIGAYEAFFSVTTPSQKIVRAPNTLTLTANGCAGTINWSNGSTGTSLVLSTVGTYAISATCTVDGCTSLASTSITGLEIQKPHRIYVNHANTSGPHNGASWATAYNDLQAALAAATANDSIWVAKGTYYPTTSTTDRNAHFSMKNDVAIYGGFAGNETQLSARNLGTNATILSGDIDRNNILDTGNSYNVIRNGNTTSNTAILDGFVLTGGYANGSSIILLSGGAVNNNGINGICHPVFRNCIFRYNTAGFGGAVGNRGDNGSCNPTFTNCLFYENQAVLNSVFSHGGAMSFIGNITAILTNCTFSNNYALTNGGAIRSDSNFGNPNLTFSNCIFWGNTASGNGNQIHNVSSIINFSHSILEGGIGAISILGNGTNNDNGGNIFTNPLFIDVANGDFRLKPCSPAIDMGATGSNVPSTDILDNARFDMPGVGTSTIDIGAYETQTTPPVAPIVTDPTNQTVCSPTVLNLTASCATGTVQWSTGATGTSLSLSTVGTYAISAKCVSDGCESDASTTSNLEIKAKPAAPVVNAPTNLVVCSPTTLSLTASCATGTVLWSNGSTGTSLTLSSVGTYAISAKCILNSCESDASTTSNLEIKAKPDAPVVTAPANLVVCSPTTLSLTAICATGTVLWSNGSTGTSLTLSSVGTYAISAKCVLNSCESDASTTSNLEIKAKPAAPVVTAPANLVVCSPTTLSLAAICATGTILWSNGSTGTSLTLSSVGTYAISAKCVLNSCESDASATSNLEIKAKPLAPVVTGPANLVVCSPTALNLTANCATGTVLWSTGATGTSLTLSSVGTFAISATCISNGCGSPPSSVVNLEIKAKPAAPVVTAPANLVVCSPTTLSLTASCATGTILWSNGNTGTSLMLSTVGTYSISAKCVSNGCESDASITSNLEIKAKPATPVVTPPANLVVCSPTTLSLTAICATGTVLWSNGSTGTSLILSTVGTYAISAKCVSNGCESDASTTKNLEIKAKPTTPVVTAPANLVVCSPTTFSLTASCATGTVLWSNGSTGTNLMLSTVGTYAISAKCVSNGCESDVSATRNLEIKGTPVVSAENTGPYIVGKTINLTGSGGGTYSWAGPNNFTSSSQSPSIPNALTINAGIYTLTVVGTNGCNASATTNVIVNGINPCDSSRIVDFMYVKAGNPHQPLFSLASGMVINQINEQVSILVTPSLCPSVTIESMEMNIQGPELNWNIIQNVAPNALFDNLGTDIWGRNFNPGNYTLTITGYAQDNKGGGITYGPKIIKFTVVGNLAAINAPTLSKNTICAGSTVDVTFNTSGTFNFGNQFRIEMSDSSGNFANPVLIGTTDKVGTSICTIPQNMPESGKYLIRVASSNQVVVGNPAINQVIVYPYNYNLVSPNDNISGASTKKATATINAANKINSSASVSYYAGKNITLMPGFETGAVFKAEIQGCNN